MSTGPEIAAVRTALSDARISTYESAARVMSPDDPSALELYAWNARVSGALLPPLHVFEVVIRNAVDDALTAVYGPMWPWSQSFEQSLPRGGRYRPVPDLQRTRNKLATPGQVIAEMKLVFWQQLFTSRHDQRLWGIHLKRVFPNASPTSTVAQLRTEIYDGLDALRHLRNRIAHHEPIFRRSLEAEYELLLKLVSYRCDIASQWLRQHHDPLPVIRARPLPRAQRTPEKT